MTEKQNYKVEGVIQFITVFVDRLYSRKKIALFSDYERAKNDIIMEICGGNTDANPSDFEDIIEKFENIASLKDYFDEL